MFTSLFWGGCGITHPLVPRTSHLTLASSCFLHPADGPASLPYLLFWFCCCCLFVCFILSVFFCFVFFLGTFLACCRSKRWSMARTRTNTLSLRSGKTNKRSVRQHIFISFTKNNHNHNHKIHQIMFILCFLTLPPGFIYSHE